ncbi:hypothetical protein E3J79_03525 [Candidatus Dependentiae bacterium]|nr:MAG: hypothetical protein E3J79_03525 [Candidatus Dependentiae bacterium]
METKMNTKSTQKATLKGAITTGKIRNYNEIIEFLDAHWTTNTNDKELQCVTQLDKALGKPSQKVDIITVAGTNGKSLTINFTTQLLREEGFKVGCFYTPHILTYNERIAINNETVSNKTFTELGNEIINAVESAGTNPNSYEILLIMALHYFAQNKVDVAIIEAPVGFAVNPVSICNPKIVAITRIVSDITLPDGQVPQKTFNTILNIVKSGSYVVSADQSKLHLQTILEKIKIKGAKWTMPIRKLAQLNYPFEQLHGRCAALAERIGDTYANTFANKETTIISKSLIIRQKGQRGRPTLEAKRHAELHPKKTIDQFWKETENTLPARFQLLDKEKPSILLDNANNFDAFKNLLLGIRLLHYQRPLKGLTLVIGCNNPNLDMLEFLKLLRYFFKKTSGQVIVCPVKSLPYDMGLPSWDIEKVTNDIKNMKIKAKASKNFEEAFETAQKSVDERHGLVVITGSSALINKYWQYKEIKKL